MNPSDLEIMHLICQKENLSMSGLAKKMIKDWLEEYEDILLSKRAEEAEKRAKGKRTYSLEDVRKKCDM